MTAVTAMATEAAARLGGASPETGRWCRADGNGRTGAVALTGRARPASRRRVIRSAAEVPPPLVDAFIGEMAERLSRTPEARECVGLSFTFVSRDVDVAPARYEVGRGGVVSVLRQPSLPSTFTFVSDAETFDGVMRGRRSAMIALLQRSIRLDGSLGRVRTLLRLLPAVQQAYLATRTQMIARHGRSYDFAF